MQYPFVASENHVFVDLAEGRFLVDTGSPLSFAANGLLTIDGRTHAVARKLGAFDVETIGRLVTGPCEGLIGMDLLGAGGAILDLAAGAIHIGPPANTVPDRAAVCPMRSVLGTPVVSSVVNGRRVDAVFDTGAQYGYLCDAALAAGLPQDGAIDDYNPVLGEMHSPAWRVVVSIAGVEFEDRVGLLTGLGASMLQMIGVNAVIGCAMLRDHVVALAPNRGELAIWQPRPR